MKPIFSPQNKKVIFFDLNNTLVDRTQTMHYAFLNTLKEYTGRWSAEDNEWDPEAIWQRYYSTCSKKTTSKKHASSSSNPVCLRHALAPLPFQFNDAVIKAFLYEFKNNQQEHAVLFPHTKNTLEALAHSYQLALISNGSRERITAKIQRLGLERLIPEAHIFHSENGYRKPHPQLFENALKKMEIKSKQALMVGDNWKTDILGSTSSGIDAIWISPNHNKKMTIRKLGNQRVVIIRKFSYMLPLFSVTST
ncbi:MAG: hypothetical protein A2189_05645 [Paenibacillus sp. RIFOXYA1_FULL_44_5]|nr:MAG: hypothetical protein A2189_05645 [Paenibacillus sp. RIFOXYA1_FULL_44_5]